MGDGNEWLKRIEAKAKARDLEVCVVGLGYVGLPLAVQFAKSGARVTGVDLDAGKVERINAGTSYIDDVPSDDLGSILGDLTGQRRGRPIDQSTEGNLAILKAHVPLKEVQTYSQTLQSITGGEGTYTLKPAHYDVVPDAIAQTIMAAYKAEDDDD